jgi:hypothetical protein
LAIAAVATLDSNISLGTVSRTFLVSGADNLSADSRLRYYMYEGSSATTKTAWWDAATAVDNTNLLYTPATIVLGILDTRMKPSGGDNHTLTLASDVIGPAATAGLVSHLIICPGNEAGDATSCASAALNDRGSGGEVTGISAGDNASVAMLVSATTGNDFQALRLNTSDLVMLSAVTVAYDGATGSTKATAASSGTATSAVMDVPAGSRVNILQTSITPGFVCGIKSGDTDNVTVIPISSGALGTAVVNDMGNGNAKSHVVCSTGGSTTLAMVYEDDNMSVYNVASDGTFTIWNDNITTTANFNLNQPIAFATSPNGDRAIAVGFVDNLSLFPKIISMSSTAATVTSLDDGTYDRGAQTDNGTIFAAAAWANDGSAGGALWVALSTDNNTGGYGIAKFADNGTTPATWSLHCGSGTCPGAAGADNISSMSMAIDTDDFMPVIAISYDPGVGDVFVGKYDNTTGSEAFEELIATATLSSGDMPVSIAASADGSAFAVGYVENAADNATIQIFYDE